MVIDKIGALSNIQSAYSNQIRKSSGTDAVDEKKSDRVEISQGDKLAEMRDAIAKAVNEAEEVRQDRVQAAREKLQNGTLINEQVIEEIADRIVDSLGI